MKIALCAILSGLFLCSGCMVLNRQKINDLESRVGRLERIHAGERGR